jgi:hypothetical protein
MPNNPIRILELEKFLPFMNDQERDLYFLFAVDANEISFTQEQEAFWQRQLDERNNNIQQKFDGLINK